MFKWFQQTDKNIRTCLIENSVENINTHKETILNWMLKIYLVTFLVSVIASISRAFDIGWHPILTVHICILLTLFLITMSQHTFSYRLRASTLVGIFFISGLFGMLSFGIASSFSALFGASILLAIIFLGLKIGIITALSALGVQLVFGLVLSSDTWFKVDFNAYVASPITWIAHTTGFIAVVMVSILGVGWLYKTHEMALETLKQRESELKQSKKELEILASTDPLTQLPNRRHLLERAHNEMARYKRKQLAFSLMMIDLDFFKQVNDNFGHDAGDSVLVAFASISKTLVRDYELVARFGGEEFVVLLPETELEAAKFVAERIRQALENLEITHAEHRLKVTASIGLTTVINKDLSIEDTLKRADEAVYLAKENGRNRVEAILI